MLDIYQKAVMITSMAVPAWILTTQGDLIPLGPSALLKISLVKNSIVLTQGDGETTNYPYDTPELAAAAFGGYIAITEAQSIGNPEIHAITAAAIQQTTLPQVITVTGVNFVASAVVVLRNYVGTTILVTAFVNSTTITATVPNTVLVGTYDVIYSDANGKAAVQLNGFQAY